jgi:hypothetical protein
LRQLSISLPQTLQFTLSVFGDGVLLVLILYKAPHSQVWVPESHSMNPPIVVLGPRLALKWKNHPLEYGPLVFDFACTITDLAEALPSSTAFFTITYWIISDEY